MKANLSLVLHVLISPLKTRARLAVEIVLLRYQLRMLRRSVAFAPATSTAIGHIHTASVISVGCRPSRTASTMSGAMSVNRSNRLKHDELICCFAAISVARFGCEG